MWSKFHQVSDLLQQPELASELDFDLQDTVDCDRKLLVDFDVGKAQHVTFDRSNNSCGIDLKMDGSSSNMLGLSFLSKLDWGSCIVSMAKITSKKIGA